MKKRVVRRGVSDISQRVHAEVTDKKSEELYRLLFENSVDAILLAQPDGKISAANPEACRMFGRSEEEIQKLGRAGIVDTRDSRLPAAIEKRRRTGQFKGELNHVKKDGVVFPCDVTAKTFRDSSRNEISVTILRDLTERKRAEQALRIAEERYRLLVENAAEAIFVAQDGMLKFINHMASEMTGYSMQELLSSPFLEFIHPDDRDMVGERYLRRLKGDVFQTRYAFRLAVRDGSIKFVEIDTVRVDWEGRPATLNFLSDITERKRAEEALRESEERYRALFKNMLNGYAFCKILVDDKNKPVDFIYIDINDTFEKITGLRKEDVIGKRITEAIPSIKELTPEIIDIYGEVASTGKPAAFEIFFKPLDIWLAISVYSPHKDYFVAIFDNITERKQAEKALRKSESDLRALTMELSRVEESERQRLALFLHDEIGQSLALLRMMFGSLAGASKLKSEKHNIQQIRNLLEKVIDQTHTLTFELSPPVLHQLGLEAAIEWAGERISHEHGIEFTFSDDGMRKPIDADRKALLFRCIRELMRNIVKHAKARRMTVSLTRMEERVFVVVEDDGVGFDKSLLERPRDLPGFGLFSVREHLTGVGGSFHLQSEPGRGTCVTLSVPLEEEKPSS